MRISSVTFSNRRRGFEVSAGTRSYWYPYARLEIGPSKEDPVVEVIVDAELDNEGFTYTLKSGRQDSVHIDQVLEYNRDPAYLRNLTLHKLTLEAQNRVKKSRLSKHEIIRRLGTSPAQFYRLLDQTNLRKSIDQLLTLLNILDCDVSFSVCAKAGASLARDRALDGGSRMKDNSDIIFVDGKPVRTLRDILPATPGLRVLFVGKCPAPRSAELGHYFKGRQGQMLWNKLRRYSILCPTTEFEDDSLLAHGFGIADIVKKSRPAGDEPSDAEYQPGIDRILALISLHRPQVVIFTYKRILDQMLRLKYGISKKSHYGFNPEHDKRIGARVFVFPMPRTPCTAAQADVAMQELAVFLGTDRRKRGRGAEIS